MKVERKTLVSLVLAALFLAISMFELYLFSGASLLRLETQRDLLELLGDYAGHPVIDERRREIIGEIVLNIQDLDRMISQSLAVAVACAGGAAICVATEWSNLKAAVRRAKMRCVK